MGNAGGRGGGGEGGIWFTRVVCRSRPKAATDDDAARPNKYQVFFGAFPLVFL